jgi:hypothetical protein
VLKIMDIFQLRMKTNNNLIKLMGKRTVTEFRQLKNIIINIFHT